MIVIIRVMAAIAAADDLRVTPDRPAGDEIGVRLLDAAAEVFAERGFEGAGVAEIARRAGVTTGAIYSRFTGKADLLASALDARTPDELEALFADHRFEGRAEDILTVVGSHLVDRTPTTGEPLLLEAFVAARRDPAVAALLRERMGEHHERLTAIIEAAKAGGGISSELDTAALVTFCHAVGFGFLLFEAFDAPLPDAEPWEQLIAHLVNALRITEPSAPAKEG
jgi:AcrR family transcriptional regulator